MKNTIIFLCIFLFNGACTPSKNTLPLDDEARAEVKAEVQYELLPADAALKQYNGKRVYFEVRFCEMEMQHMLRPSLQGNNDYFCVDRIDETERIGQLLAYTSEDIVAIYKKYDDQPFIIFGTIGMISGAGKGGGTHTEYYLEMEKCTALK